MSRNDGFSIADLSTSLLDDPKFRALWRRLNDPSAMGQAVTVYLAAVLESWRSGERSTAIDAAPMWLADVNNIIVALTEVGLLDEAGRIPDRAWQSWFGPASGRRNATRERWQKANEKRRGKGSPSGSSDVTARSPRGDIGDTVRPSVPTDPSEPCVHGDDARPQQSDDADPAFTLRQWLAKANAPVRDGDGYHVKLVRMVASDSGKTCADVLAAFERLKREGARTSKQFVMGAEDALFPPIKGPGGKGAAGTNGKTTRSLSDTDFDAGMIGGPEDDKWISGPSDG
ncbi:MAG: hypothetical protein ACHQ01_07805 [Candidatus Limnocylindrales bacterium]